MNEEHLTDLRRWIAETTHVDECRVVVERLGASGVHVHVHGTPPGFVRGIVEQYLHDTGSDLRRSVRAYATRPLHRGELNALGAAWLEPPFDD